MNNTVRVLRNFVFILFARGMQILSGFFLLIGAARYLKTDEFGDYTFTVAFVAAILSLSYFGIQMILIREVAKDKEKAASYIGIAILLRLFMSLCAIGILIIAVQFISFSDRIMSVIYIALLSETLLSFSFLVKAVFQAFERMEYEPLLTTIYALVLLSGVGTVIFFDLGFQGLFGVIALSQVVGLSFGTYLLLTRFVVPTISFDWYLLKFFFKKAIIIGLGVIFIANLFRINVLMLKWLKGADDVAFFQSAHGLILQMEIVPVSLMTGLFPLLSRLTHENHPRPQTIYGQVIKFIFIIALLFAVYLWSFSHEIIGLLFAARYLPSVATLKILSVAVIFLFLDIAISNILISIDKQRYITIYGGLTIVLDVLIALILVPKYGYIGAAYTALFAYFVLCSFSFYILKINHFSFSWLEILIKPALAGLITMVVLLSIKPYLSLIAAPLGIVVYLVTLVLIQSLSRDEMLLFKRFVLSFFRGRENT